jgi:hypothetical protein
MRHRREMSTGDWRNHRKLQRSISELRNEKGELDTVSMSDENFERLMDLLYESVGLLMLDIPGDVLRQIDIGALDAILAHYNGYFEKATSEKSDAEAGPTSS